MNSYTYAKWTTDRQRSLIVVSLRRSGCFACRMDADTLRTDASRTAIGLCWGNTMVVK